jgi:osmotically-inducible protein OsmY
MEAGDEEVRANVIEELALDPEVDSSETAIAVRDGLVELRGTVSTYAQRIAAAQAARRVAGVRDVKNELEVRLLDAHSRRDAELERAAIDSLIWTTTVPDSQIEVQVKDGCITLSGEVEWEFQRVAAEQAVCNLVGVRGVTNEIHLGSRVTPKDVQETIEKALVRNAHVDAGHVQVRVREDGVVLQGKVRTWLEHDEAVRAARRMPGVTAVHDNLAVVP